MANLWHIVWLSVVHYIPVILSISLQVTFIHKSCDLFMLSKFCSFSKIQFFVTIQKKIIKKNKKKNDGKWEFNNWWGKWEDKMPTFVFINPFSLCEKKTKHEDASEHNKAKICWFENKFIIKN